MDPAELAWHRSANYEWNGQEIHWGRSHQTLFETVWQHSGLSGSAIASVFLWVANHDPKQVEISLDNWADPGQRRDILRHARGFPAGGDEAELAKLMEQTQEDIQASADDPEPGQEAEAPPGKSAARPGMSPPLASSTQG